MSYSQCGQDDYILSHFPKDWKGYFVDVGAGADVYSNSLLLEQAGWDGIAVEPQNDKVNWMIENRKCHIWPGPVFSDERYVEFVIDGHASGILGIPNVDMVTASAKDRGHKSIQMKTSTLTAVLDRFKAPKLIDLLSIDTEGSELEILRGLDLSKYMFNLIIIEHNFQKHKRVEIDKLLVARGYEWDCDIKQDMVYKYNVPVQRHNI